jgi:hypothetical protein
MCGAGRPEAQHGLCAHRRRLPAYRRPGAGRLPGIILSGRARLPSPSRPLTVGRHHVSLTDTFGGWCSLPTGSFLSTRASPFI